MRRAAGALKVPPEELPERVEALAKEIRQLKKQAAAGPKGGPSVEQLIADAAEIGGVKVVIAEVPGGPNELRQMIDQIRRKAAPVAVLLGQSAGRREEGDADRRPEPRPGRSRAGRGGVGARGVARWSKAAAAAGPTWPKPAASCPTSSPRPSTRPAARSKDCWAEPAAMTDQPSLASSF